MKKRNIVTCIILSIITCGIYSIYWFICITNDMKTISGDTKSASGGMAFLFTLITCNIYGWYWAYVRGQNLDAARQSKGKQSSNSGILFIILQALGLGIVAYALMQSKINDMVTE